MNDKYKIIIFVWLLLPTILFSQIKIHKSITTGDGLVNGQARYIFEDSKGYIWFSTNGGVSRWDGENFLNFTERNGLTSTHVFDIAEAPDGTIYFANFGVNGINTFKDGKIDTLFNTGKSKLTFLTIIYFMKDSSLIMGASDGIYIFKNNTLLNLNDIYEIPAETMHNFDENSEGDVFISTSSGIVKIRKSRLTVEYGYDGGDDDYVHALGIDKNDNLYFTNEKQFLVMRNTKIEPVNEKFNFLSNNINDIIFSNDNVGYLATNFGLGILDEYGNIDLITKENGLSSNKQYKIYESKNGTIYIASAIANIDIYEPGKLENYSVVNGLPSNNIFNIYIDKNKTKYIGTGDGLLIETVNTKKTITPKLRDGYTNFISFAEMNNKVFIGTETGIDIIEDGNVKVFFKLKKIRNVKHHESNRIFSLAKLNDSTLLAGTYKGVYKFVDDSISTITKKDGLLSNYVSTIIILKDKSILYGYHGKGISIYKNGNYKHYTMENGLSGNTITDLCERSDGAIMVGVQQGGINIIKNDKIDTITTKNGLTSNDIRAIDTDYMGNVYVTTSLGLNIINFSEDGFTIRTMTKKDGLIGNDCSKDALFVDDDNNVWIGTSSGLSKYNPIYDKPNLTPPPVYISGIEIFNKPVSINNFLETAELNYDENYINFIYTGINIPSTHKTIYQYKLSGIDNNWVTSKKNNVQYTSLDDGSYTFEVKASNEWGIWSKPTSLSFVITPAWWETWWFYTLAFIAVGSLIAFISSYRYRHLLSVEKMRTKISSDLHDSVGSGLSEISILSELIGAQIPKENESIKSGMGNISTISKTLIESMSDIVWLVNPKKDTLKDLFKRLQLSYHEVLKFTDIDLMIENLEQLDNIRLPMNFRQHLYLIFKEAINNAIKYSDGDLLNLKIETTGNNLKVIFSDNGKGFELNSEKLGNGLINMKNRAKEIGGNINYFSQIDKGTKVIFEGKFQKQKTSFI